ncbi:putative secreted protein [Corynebacterium resistens DSM 45100]|uniref:Secreted protein n=1 Tax=Corynebacterium resistens (strain DSM 45100 / JCM 12819 / GTC 2026 / SICGH 158) TaxID=662755 RepID=F8E1Q4_CORRG|nr:hypothetical protein [Corynebacterium resistens]AEI09321.1 putative secreted protein [Corynebacterium resistens DSM 45100]
MRGKIGGTAVAFVVTLSMAALSGCSVSFVDALSDSPKANERQRSAGVGGGEGRSHEAEGDSGHSGGADRGAKEGAGKRSGNNPGELTSGDSGESSDEASSGQGTGNEGAPAGEGARPAGHEGLWFDSEPKDPWDKYVWKSQKFIGKGGDIPKLGPGTADKTFWGLPDLCSKQMQKKMKVVGFEFVKMGANDDELRFCLYRELSVVPGRLNLRNGLVSFEKEKPVRGVAKGNGVEWPFQSFDQVEKPELLPDVQCSAQRKFSRDAYLLLSVADGELGLSKKESCELSIRFTQVIKNTGL